MALFGVGSQVLFCEHDGAGGILYCHLDAAHLLEVKRTQAHRQTECLIEARGKITAVGKCYVIIFNSKLPKFFFPEASFVKVRQVSADVGFDSKKLYEDPASLRFL